MIDFRHQLVAMVNAGGSFLMGNAGVEAVTQALAEIDRLTKERDALADETKKGSYQSRELIWLLECMGPEIAANKTERSHRFLEESLELVQASGATRDECLQLVDYVYGREIGKIGQEVGGVMNTLAALCTAHGVDMDQEAETELARARTKVAAIRAKHDAKPRFSPLPQ